MFVLVFTALIAVWCFWRTNNSHSLVARGHWRTRRKLCFVKRSSKRIHHLYRHVIHRDVYHCKSSKFKVVSPEKQRAAFRYFIFVTCVFTYYVTSSNNEIINRRVGLFQVLNRGSARKDKMVQSVTSRDTIEPSLITGYSGCNWVPVPGGSPRNIGGWMCGPLPETLTIFQTKICNVPCPTSDQAKQSIPYFRPAL